ncbi:MAG: tetratricopeptide repeat protein [Thermonemataceae bacterium]|nr:tetratricopeptide repeat protein [Thermonemataceae bacterium]
MKKILLVIYLLSYLSAFSQENYLAKSKEALQKNEIKEAIAWADKAIERDSLQSDNYLQRGLCLYAFSQYDTALKDYTKAISLNMNNKEAFYNRGVLYYWLDKDSLALKDFQQAILVDDKDARSHTALGVLYVKMANGGNQKYVSLAQKSYEKAIEVNSNYASAYYNLALLLAEEKPKESLFYLEKQLVITKDADGLLLKGIILGDLKNYQEALSALEEAEKLKPADYHIYAEKAWVLWKTKKKKEACESWRKAKNLGDVEAEVWLKKYCK